MEKTTVLIIEDEAKLLKTLSDYLTIHQYRVLQASNGLDGIQQFSSHHAEIDIILLDIMLPFADGFEVLNPYIACIEAVLPMPQPFEDGFNVYLDNGKRVRLHNIIIGTAGETL